MIMGAGKTTVVGPVLAMLLATAQNLIVEVLIILFHHHPLSLSYYAIIMPYLVSIILNYYFRLCHQRYWISLLEYWEKDLVRLPSVNQFSPFDLSDMTRFILIVNAVSVCNIHLYLFTVYSSGYASAVGKTPNCSIYAISYRYVSVVCESIYA